LRAHLLIILIAFAALCSGAGWVGAASLMEVEIVLSENSTPYQQFSQTLQNAAQTSIHFTVTPLATRIRTKPDVYIALGLKALEALRESHEPVIAALVSSNDYVVATLDSENLPRSAVFLDQPKQRQLQFVRAALPKTRNIGVLYSRQSLLELEKLRSAAVAHNLNLETNAISSAEDLYNSIESISHNVDVLLATSDSSIYNGANIRNILLTTYRHDIPLIGISQSYVNAGALAAIFSPTEQMAEDVLILLQKFGQSGSLPAAQYPSTFGIAINLEVARSLNISLPAANEIRQRMHEMEYSR
jgi:ABC-type uncharacterized transport system substrate-binding protein